MVSFQFSVVIIVCSISYKPIHYITGSQNIDTLTPHLCSEGMNSNDISNTKQVGPPITKTVRQYATSLP